MGRSLTGKADEATTGGGGGGEGATSVSDLSDGDTVVTTSDTGSHVMQGTLVGNIIVPADKTLLVNTTPSFNNGVDVSGDCDVSGNVDISSDSQYRINNTQISTAVLSDASDIVKADEPVTLTSATYTANASTAGGGFLQCTDSSTGAITNTAEVVRADGSVSQVVTGQKSFTSSVTTDQSSAAFALIGSAGYMRAFNSNTNGSAFVQLHSTYRDSYVELEAGSTPARIGRFIGSNDVQVVNAGFTIPATEAYKIAGVQKLTSDQLSLTGGFTIDTSTANTMSFGNSNSNDQYLFRVNGGEKLSISNTLVQTSTTVDLRYQKTGSATGEGFEVVNRNHLTSVLNADATAATQKSLIVEGGFGGAGTSTLITHRNLVTMTANQHTYNGTAWVDNGTASAFTVNCALVFPQRTATIDGSTVTLSEIADLREHIYGQDNKIAGIESREVPNFINVDAFDTAGATIAFLDSDLAVHSGLTVRVIRTAYKQSVGGTTIYRVQLDGRVYDVNSALHNGTSTDNRDLFYLPADYRPSFQKEYSVQGHTGEVLCRIAVTTAGLVSVVAAGTSDTVQYADLAQVAFWTV